MAKLDLTNKVFNKLTALEVVGKNKHNHIIWKCVCQCGNTKNVTTNALMSGNNKSCGCLVDNKGESNSNYSHGKSKSKVHNTWLSMKNRCYNKNSHRYNDYGAKGITVDPLFINDFTAFYKEVGDPPSNNHSLDRINYKLGYIQGNLRWATNTQQCRNKGKTKNNTSGVNGVHFAQRGNNTYAVAAWRTLDGRSKSKCFNCTKLGLLLSFKLAFIERENQLKLLNNNGAGYSYNHGQ